MVLTRQLVYVIPVSTVFGSAYYTKLFQPSDPRHRSAAAQSSPATTDNTAAAHTFCTGFNGDIVYDPQPANGNSNIVQCLKAGGIENGRFGSQDFQVGDFVLNQATTSSQGSPYEGSRSEGGSGSGTGDDQGEENPFAIDSVSAGSEQDVATTSEGQGSQPSQPGQAQSLSNNGCSLSVQVDDQYMADGVRIGSGDLHTLIGQILGPYKDDSTGYVTTGPRGITAMCGNRTGEYDVPITFRIT